jgi:hypothetical protein
MASISRTLQRIKQDIAPYLPDPWIVQACQEVQHRWRRRQFDPVQTLHLFLLQILCFNTALNHLRHLSKLQMTAAGFCKARKRLPLAVLQRLLRRSAQALRQDLGRRGGFCGLRAYLVDGSSTITPDTPALDQHFGHPTGQKRGCSLPVPKLLGLFDAYSGLILEVLCLPLFIHEQAHVWKLHPLLGSGDLLVGDRGFCSYVHLAMLQLRQIQGCFRLHQRQIVSFRHQRQPRKKGQRGKPTSRFLQRLGKYDQLVQWRKPPTHSKPQWIALKQYQALPQWLTLRELRYVLSAKGQRTRVVTIVTTLTDPVKYPKQEIAALYGLRWTVETHLGELKTHLKMRKLKCKIVAGVEKELAVYCLVYNLVHAVMLKAAQRQQLPPDRISFLDTVRWLLSAEPGEKLPKLIVNPRRSDRHEPRVVKDLPDSYRKMSKSRNYLKHHREWAKR